LTRYALYFWGPKYISESLGEGDLGALASALTATSLPIGGALGVILCGYLSDRVFQARRIPITVICLLLTSGIMLFGLHPIEQPWVMAGFFFCIGFFLFGPDSIISGTATMDFGSKQGAGTATGLVNGIGSIGAILGGYLPGVVTTEDNWSPLFYIFLGGLVVSAMLLVPLWNALPDQRETTSRS
jgi:OPA family sugar phosphate sensor protein UhpC-like MFS transporter